MTIYDSVQCFARYNDTKTAVGEETRPSVNTVEDTTQRSSASGSNRKQRQNSAIPKYKPPEIVINDGVRITYAAQAGSSSNVINVGYIEEVRKALVAQAPVATVVVRGL